jgi:hypothetical protein
MNIPLPALGRARLGFVSCGLTCALRRNWATLVRKAADIDHRSGDGDCFIRK